MAEGAKAGVVSVSSAVRTAVDAQAGPSDLGDIIRRDTQERYRHVHGYFYLRPPAGLEPLPCARLAEPAILTGLIERFSAGFPAATDRRAIASLWSQYYLSALVMGPALCWLELQRLLPLRTDGLTLLLDPQTARPAGFLLADAGEIRTSGDIFHALEDATHDHLATFIPNFAGQTGLSRRLLWSNAAAYLAYVLHEIGDHGDPALEIEGLAILTERFWPDGRANPFAGLMNLVIDGDGALQGERRLCCLRYAIPGVSGCGRICPASEGRCKVAG